MALLIYKQRDPVPNKKNTPASNFHHSRYIATRPRVLRCETLTHGLFGNFETKNLQNLQKLILQKSYERKNIHRGIISFSTETAKALNLKNRKDWQKFVEQNILIIARENGIKVQNLKWIAAAHNERNHPHVHIMFWDESQTQPQSKVSPAIPNNIRKQLIKNVFADEISVYYEEKNRSLTSLRQITGEMIEEFEKNFVSDVKSNNIPHFNSDFNKQKIKEIAKEIFALREKIPKRGRLLYQLMPPDIKEELDRISEKIIDSNEQLKSVVNQYIDSKLNLTEMYTDNMDVYEKATKDYQNEARKIISNGVLEAIKTIIQNEYQQQKQMYTEQMKIAFTKQFVSEVFFFFGNLTCSNNDENCRKKQSISSELSKQAKKEKYKQFADSSGYEMND